MSAPPAALVDIRLSCQPGKEGKFLVFPYKVQNQGTTGAYVMDAVASVDRGSRAAKASPQSVWCCNHVWVEANPKETELTWVKPGDHATVDVDTYPGHHWDGVVESIAPNSGSEFSILPAQNSSGNWVKVVQRIAVRVRVDRHPGDPPLRAGMSVEVEIDTGHHRTLADLF